MAPSGGAKDTKPPQLIQTSPPNFQTNFSSRKISMEFDEYVQTKDPQTQVIVSPPLQYPLEYLSKGKSLQIKITDTLQANTTYNFNFGRSIADLNEGNLLPEFNYVFSTGNHIDSLQIDGSIVDAFSRTPEADVVVMLYKENSDSLPYQKLPAYFDRTDQAGNFSVKNVAQASYKIFALLDKNNNYRYDNPDEEKIAFLDSLVTPIFMDTPDTNKKALTKADTALNQSLASSDTTTIKRKGKNWAKNEGNPLQLTLFSEPKEKQNLKKWMYDRIGKLQLVYTIPFNKFNYEWLKPLSSNTWESLEYSSNKDSVILWMNDTLSDSLNIRFWVDSFPADTLKLLYKKVKKEGAKGKTKQNTPEKWHLQIPGTGMDPTGEINLSSPKPLVLADFTKAILSSGKDTLEFKLLADSLSQRKVKIKYPWKQDKEYRFYIPPGALEDIDNKPNDTLQVQFKVKAAKEFGTMKLKLSFEKKPENYVLQLLNEKGLMVREKKISKDGNLFFSFLLPGHYKFRLIIDSNGNGRWDSGKYLEHRQPEPVIIYNGKIEIKANWDLDLEWVVK